MLNLRQPAPQRHSVHPFPRPRLVLISVVAGMLTVALVLLLAGCGASTSANMGGVLGAAATATPTLTASTIVPGPQLQWRAVTAPSRSAASLAVAPGDGDVAYTLTAPSQGGTQAQSFVTHDAGASWTPGGTMAVGSPPSTSNDAKPFMLQGGITVAAGDPTMAVSSTVWLQAGESGDVSLFSNSVTFDSGAHWQQLSGHATFRQLSSYQGRIYALRMAGGASGDHLLFVGTAQMATWQAIDAALPAPVLAFWLDPSSGALLAETDGQGTASDLFYSSADGGASWAKLPAPQLDPATQQWAVQQPSSGRPLQICGSAGPTWPNGQGIGAKPATLTCSTDGGQSWQTRPALNTVAYSPKGYDYYTPAGLVAIAADGSLLATGGAAAVHMYRLRPGDSVWQDLGPLPSSISPIGYYPTPSGALLWTSGQQGVQVASYPPS